MTLVDSAIVLAPFKSFLVLLLMGPVGSAFLSNPVFSLLSLSSKGSGGSLKVDSASVLALLVKL